MVPQWADHVGKDLLENESARKRGIWITIIGRDQMNMISLNLKTLQLQRLNGISTLVNSVTACR